MSEDTGAAAAAAEPIAAPEAHTEQVTPPNPIDSQGPQPTPPEPKAAEAKPEKPASIKDALAKADAELKANPKEPAKPKTEVKSEPKAETKEVKSDGPIRDQSGKFASKDPKAETQPEASPEGSKDTPWRESPKRFSDDARRDWEKAPDSVKAETHRAIREIEDGLKEYQKRWEPLKEYDRLAREEYGTTIKDALDRYTGLEKKLMSADPREKFSALQHLFDYADINMREFAAQLAGVTPEQSSVHFEGQLQALRGQLAEAQERLSRYERKEQDATMQTVEQFAEKHPRFDELSTTIAKFLENGFAENLDEAYAMADRLKPAAAQASPETPVIPATETAPPQPRAQKSIAGTPTPGSSPAQRKASPSIKEALQRAMAQAG